jgi:hypothetical protein
MNITWYCPDSVNINFNNPTDNPSFRLRCFNIHNYLISKGYSSKIINNPNQVNKNDMVVLMSFGEQEYDLAKWVTQYGGKMIHDYSENIRGIPVLEKTKELCSYIVCCSTWLGEAEALVYKEKVKVIKDMIEKPPVIKNPFHINNKLKVVWSGMGGNAEFVKLSIKPIIESNDMEYVEISNREEANIRWDSNWPYYMASCDIAICPQMHWLFPAKSNVKVSTAISLGLPTIASPILSYEEIICDGFNGYIAYDLDDWDQYLKEIKLNKPYEKFYRNNLGILSKYSLESISEEWLDIFKKC